MDCSSIRSVLLFALFVFLGIQVPCQAGIIVSLDGLTLDANNRARIRVLVEHDGNGVAPEIDNFNVRLRIDSVSGIGGGMLGILNDGEPLNVRINDPNHLFANKEQSFFSSVVFNNAQEIEVLDSVGLLDTSAVLSRQRLLTAFNIAELASKPIVGGERFRIQFDEIDSVFFDSTFLPIQADQIEFRSGQVIAAAVPEPSTFVLGMFALAIGWFLPRSNSVRVDLRAHHGSHRHTQISTNDSTNSK